jgi:nicotinamide riboside kinase
VPGSGKTSTTRALAVASKQSFKSVEAVSEYARRYIAKYGQIHHVWEQFRILKKQENWENAIGTPNLLITDAPIFMGLAYAQLLSTNSVKDTMVINDLFKEMNKLNKPNPRYDIIFHLPPICKPVDDGIRAIENFDDKWRIDLNDRIIAISKIFPPVQHINIISSSIDDRVDECMQHLKIYSELQTK